MRPGGLIRIGCGLAVAATALHPAKAGVLETGAVHCAAPAHSLLPNGDAALCPAIDGQSAKAPADFGITAAASDRGTFWAQDGALLTLSADAELDRAISFRAANLVTPFGTMEIRGGVGRTQTSDALTFDRLRWSDPMRQDATAIGIGATQTFAGGRLSVASDLSWSNGSASWRDGTTLEPWSQSGFAASHKIDAKLFDSADFKWSLSGQLATRTAGYQGNPAARPPGTFGPAGDTQRGTTKLEAFGSSLLASHDGYDGLAGTRDATRVELATGGLTLAAYEKLVRRRSPFDASAFATEKQVQGIQLEIEPASLSLDLPQSALIPTSLTVGWETGTKVEGAATGDLRQFEATAIWTTAWGDTTAIYSADGEDSRSVPGEFEENVFVDLSHSAKFGAWRVSAGAGISLLDSRADDETFAYDGTSYSLAVRYAPAEGPHLESRLGRSESAFEFDEDFAERSKRLTLTTTLDLSDPVRRRLSREDLTLKLEYRQDLTAREETERSDTAMLVTFAIQKLGGQ
jgi:hypothetical protein